ncbi:hypothetical protein J2X31_002522 [Flavobacterium arsenatis]|uniref:IPExxxVDY family protein n=1 Tax=Flavobacterium arsenatis TaxID=1484332 RepID=A0ABU1TRL1_9FLAO|nr:hypothetical protein [Flavobacterium arsenatis]MDR6968499.1 hypothetical protein [Flavobacterium arsenatis]
MIEINNIKYNIKGEKPTKGYEIIHVRGISNAKEVLENFKNAVMVILRNKSLSDEDSKWEKLLPEGIVNKIKQLDDDNKKYDELLYDIDSSIYHFQDLKDWEWYSSLEVENGFDIIVKGDFSARFVNFIHCQNVPLANIKIVNADKNEYYELKTFKDYTTYKTLK